MAEKFDIGKLLRGFNIFTGAGFGQFIYTASITLVVILIVGGILWRAFLKQDAPIDQSSQQAETIHNVEVAKDRGFRLFGFEFCGWRK